MTDVSETRMRGSVSVAPDGKELTRHLSLRAADEADAIAHADCPAIGDTIDLGSGSTSQFAYCVDVSLELVESVAADDADAYLWEVTAKYKTRGKDGGATPVANKARWKVSFRPQQIHISHVNQEADQTRYGGGSGSELADTIQEKFPVKTEINSTPKEIQGVDIDEMVEVLVIDFWKAQDDVQEFVEAVRPLAGRTNEGAFEGPWGSYAEGEARITGIEVSQTSGEIATVSVEISRRENRTVSLYLDLLGADASVSKEGWQYLWVRAMELPDDGDDSVLKMQSVDGFVATLPGYEKVSFEPLGIDEDLWT